ncbi:hypothetical protein WJX73_004092 [Symbiochloris irregularis]|uniref:Ribonuclease n=1 Tax=Symbiochloris irregularis TaxID=706552 RepID=A0AAW1NSZ0_9CHLO
MATGWLRGTVKEVPSGDTVVIAGTVKGGPPPEKRITLSSLVAPKLGRRDGQQAEEPFAWQSREFLRQLCIGQACTFKVDYTVDSIAGREFGSVFIGSNSSENVAVTVAAKGWAKVRTQGGSQSPYYDQLVNASKVAEGSSLGLFNKADTGTRRTPAGQDFDVQQLLDQHGKGKVLPAIVEQIPSGSFIRLTLLEGFHSVAVNLCGVQAPSMGRRAPAASAAAKPAAGSSQPASTGGTEQAATGAESSASAAVPPATAAAVAGAQPESAPEPFAREAKHFAETKALNREVRITLEGVDKFGNILGSVRYPEGAGEAIDLALSLVQNGLVKVVEWGANMLPQAAGHKLREAERAAKQAKKGMWHNWTPPAGSAAKLSDKFTGTVREVVNGDLLVIADSASGVSRRIYMSSVRSPRIGRRDERPEPWAIESKELLRTTVIGKEVSVSLEYSRAAGGGGRLPGQQPPQPQQQQQGDLMHFGTVTIGNRNVAELMLSQGLSTVAKHRIDDERSAHYEALMEAEQAAKKAKKGIFSGRDAPLHNINDVSTPGNAQKAKQFLPFLQRTKKHGVVENVINGHRMRIFIPKEGCLIVFSPSGVRAPSMPPREGTNAAMAKQHPGEPYGEEATAFTYAHVQQREVEIEVDTMDRGGTFLGTLTVTGSPPFNLGRSLLKAGLARLHPSFDPAYDHDGNALSEAQAEAQQHKRKIWEKYEPAANGETHANGDQASAAEPESVSITVTDVTDAAHFYLQMIGEQRTSWIEEQLQSLSLDTAAKPARLRQGQQCIARFSVDKRWYRAKVLSANTRDPTKPAYDVSFIDFGNKEAGLGADDVREMGEALAAVPPQAHAAQLAFLQVSGVEDEYGHEAAQLLSDNVGNGRHLKALITQRDRSQQPPVLHLLILTPEQDSAKDSVNTQILAEGLARLKMPPAGQVKVTKEVKDSLAEAEADAKKEHRGIWRYGDVDDDEEDDVPARKPAWGRR